MKAFCAVAVLSGAKADGDCVGDLMTVGKDVAGAGMAIKDIAVHCHGSDRGPCQDAVDKLLTQISTAVTDIGPCTTSCGSHSPACVDEIKTLGDKINAIDGPAKRMADECAGAHKSTISCVFDGIKIGADVAAVAGEIARVVGVCKKGDDIDENGLKCSLCKDIAKEAKGKGTKECHKLCGKAGPMLGGICGSLCDAVAQHLSPDAVCKKIHLCKHEEIEKLMDLKANATWPPKCIKDSRACCEDGCGGPAGAWRVCTRDCPYCCHSEPADVIV